MNAGAAACDTPALIPAKLMWDLAVTISSAAHFPLRAADSKKLLWAVPLPLDNHSGTHNVL